MAHYMQDFTERMRIIKGRLVRLWADAPRPKPCGENGKLALAELRKGLCRVSSPCDTLQHPSCLASASSGGWQPELREISISNLLQAEAAFRTGWTAALIWGALQRFCHMFCTA